MTKSLRYVLAATLALSFANFTAAQTTPREDVDIEQLRVQLEKGLKARTPQEFRYVDRVLDLVESRVLPIKLVDSAYTWSRRKSKKHPFPYFQRTLTILAEKVDIDISVADDED